MTNAELEKFRVMEKNAKHYHNYSLQVGWITTEYLKVLSILYLIAMYFFPPTVIYPKILQYDILWNKQRKGKCSNCHSVTNSLEPPKSQPKSTPSFLLEA